jgi:hypothetical protein
MDDCKPLAGGSGLSTGAAGGGGGVGDEAVALLLDSVPRELLARAALRCGAPARALLFFEAVSHINNACRVISKVTLITSSMTLATTTSS